MPRAHAHCGTCRQTHPSGQRCPQAQARRAQRYGPEHQAARAALLARLPLLGCHWCNTPLGADLHADHHNGTWVPACPACNSSRRDRPGPPPRLS